MDGRLDIDSFEKAITGLNKNLSDVGLLFRAYRKSRGIRRFLQSCK